jgi:hypothetical protein
MSSADHWLATLGIFGIITANMMLIGVRAFASRNGLDVRWWSRSYAPERQHLRTLAASPDREVARKARRYLYLETLAWVVGLPSIAAFFWGVM